MALTDNPMKHLFIFILAFAYLNVSGQLRPRKYDFGTEIVYEYRYIKDSTDKSNITSKKMSLLLNDSLSLFASSKTILDDSVLLTRIKTGIGSPTGTVVASIHSVNPTNYYIIKKKGTVKTLDPVNGYTAIINNEVIEMTEELGEQKWMIGTDTMEISGIKCQRAELFYGNRSWIAWFALDIPISDGPYKFGGLPGLIVSMKDKQGYFEFTLSSLQKHHRQAWMYTRPDLIIKPMAKLEFFKARRYYQDNIYENMVLKITSPKFDDEAKKESRLKAQKLIKENNNWIEKY